MSADNQLIISKRKDGKWGITHVDFGGGRLSDKFPTFDNLEDAVKEANKFMKEFEVEYGLNIVTE